MDKKILYVIDGLEIDSFGNKYWYKNAQFHREDCPAIEFANGDNEWFLYGIQYSEIEFNRQRYQVMISLDKMIGYYGGGYD